MLLKDVIQDYIAQFINLYDMDIEYNDRKDRFETRKNLFDRIEDST